MKKLRLLPLILIAAVFYCGEIPVASAQDATQAVADDLLPLEKVPERLKQISDGFTKDVDVFVAVVDSEVAAGRASVGDGQILRTLAKSERLDPAKLKRAIPQDSTAISDAANELAAAFRLAGHRSSVAVNSQLKFLRQRMRDIVLGRPKPEEVARFARTLQQINELRRDRYNPHFGHTQLRWENLLGIVDAIKPVTDARNVRSEPAVFAAAATLNSKLLRDGLFTPEEIKSFATPFLEHARKAVEVRGAAIEAMIDVRKPCQEILTAVEGYATDLEQLKQMGDNPDEQLLKTETAAFYKEIANILGALESLTHGEIEARLKGAVNQRGDSHQQITASHTSNRERIAGRIRQEAMEKFARLHEQHVAAIQARMAAVKEPADIGALIAEISKLGASDKKGGLKGITMLAVPLADIQKAWNMKTPTRNTLESYIAASHERFLVPLVLRKEFVSLHNRVLRTVYANTLKAPELTAAPYVDKDPDAAVETLCDNLAGHGEWRRLYEILELRTSAETQRPTLNEKETMDAIRSFLTGKNCELSEQWTDAVVAYKSVLRSTVQRAPIQAAADSIKVIAKTHPEAFKAVGVRNNTDANIAPAQKNTIESPGNPSAKPVPNSCL